MRKRKDLRKTMKVIPLSVAAVAFASGTLFAAAAEEYKYDTWVKDANDQYIKIDDTNRELLKEAFLAGKDIVVGDGAGKYVDFGKYASEASLDDMWDKDEYDAENFNPY